MHSLAVFFARFVFVAIAVGAFSGANGDEPPRTQDIAFTSRLDGTEQRYVVVLPKGFRKDVPA